MLGEVYQTSTQKHPEGEPLFRIDPSAIAHGCDTTLTLFSNEKSALFQLSAADAIELGHQLQLAGMIAIAKKNGPAFDPRMI